MAQVPAFLWLLILFLVGVAQPSDSIHRLNQLSWEIIYSHPDTAIYYSHQARAIAQINDLAIEEIRSEMLLGIAHDVKSNYDSALIHYYLALDKARISRDTLLIAGSLSNIGLTFWHLGSFHKALEKLYEALKALETTKHNELEMANVLNNIGLLYSEMKDYQQSVSYFNRTQMLYQNQNDSLGLGAVKTNLAIAWFRMGHPHRAFQLLDISILIKRRMKDLYGLSISLNQKALFLIELQEIEAAYPLLKESLIYCQHTNNLAAQATAYQLLQDVFANRKNFDKAFRYNKMSYDIATTIMDRKLIADHFNSLAKLHRTQGNFKKAYFALEQYLALKDSLINTSQLNNIYQFELEHQLDKKQTQIAQLEQQQQVHQLKLERQELILSKRNLLIIATVSASLVVFMLFYIQHNKLRQRYKRQLIEATLKQKSLQAHKIIQAGINERKRISHELHNSLGQLLSLLKMNLTVLNKKYLIDNAAAKQRVDEMMSLSDKAISELRIISQNLSPVMLHQKGLASALNDMIDHLRIHTAIKLKLNLINLDQRLDDLIENTVFAVIQESVHNAIKHAECSNIDIQLLQTSHELTLMIEDNGKGFDQCNSAKGMGLQLIDEKITNLSGHFHLDAMPGRGTIVNIIIPIKNIFEV